MRRAAIAALLLLAACGGGSDEGRVGEFSNDILGNQIRVEALQDPAIPGVVCHLGYFERSVLDRVGQGNWFEDPSNTAVSCQKVGPVDLSGVPAGRAGAEIFSQRESLFFKRIALRRIVDLENRSIVYVSHSREVIQGSAKISLSAVPLTAEEAATARR